MLPEHGRSGHPSLYSSTHHPQRTTPSTVETPEQMGIGIGDRAFPIVAAAVKLRRGRPQTRIFGSSRDT
eukprot:354078-Chlamydomonas_euryale.AAC.2